MLYLLSATLLAVLALLAWHDLRERRLPNGLVGLVAVLWVPLGWSLGLATASASVAVAASVLAAGAAAWRAGWLGAGDAKLLAALSLWAGPALVGPFLLVTALAGGVLAAAALAGQARSAESGSGAPGATTAALVPLPYGLAVAAGGAWLTCRLLAA